MDLNMQPDIFTKYSRQLFGKEDDFSVIAPKKRETFCSKIYELSLSEHVMNKINKMVKEKENKRCFQKSSGFNKYFNQIL